MKRYFASAPLLLCLTACSSQPFTIIPSTSPLPGGVRGDIPTHGSDCQYSLLGLLPVTLPPNTHLAMQHAKSAASADVLTDVAIDTSSGYFFLFSANCVHVRGLGVSRHITTPLQHRQVGRYSSPPDTEQMPGSEVGEDWRNNAPDRELRGSDDSADDWESGGIRKY